jgi:hypothetical protein
MQQLRHWLPDFLESHDLNFHHFGAETSNIGPGFAELVGVDPARVTTTPAMGLSNYFKAEFPFDIGLVPLVDIPFNHAKSFLKGIEYSARGIPFVAQDLPEYQYLSSTGVGRIAHTPDDWVRELTALLPIKVRKVEALQNFNIVAHAHSIEARADDWRSILSP